MTAPEVTADLVLLGLAAPKAQAVGELWGAEKGTLTKGAIDSTLTVNQLLDMDWRFGVVASSKCAKDTPARLRCAHWGGLAEPWTVWAPRFCN